jgi:large repetitive protein
LVALPGEAEPHYFATEPVKLVFATNNLALLYKAYGKKLQVRLKPSSYRAVPSTLSVPHPFPLNESTLNPVKATVLSPWEDAAQNLVANSCVPVDGDRIRHTMTTIPIPLDLYTDYVIDIEMLDQAAADGTPGERIWRGSFSTGGFRTVEEFATSFQIARVQHRGVHNDDSGKLAAIAVNFASRNPQGAELDSALTAAGLDPQPVPKVPRAIVFWESGVSDPQPVAVLLDASEPMWRSRPIPTEVLDPGSALGKHYEMVAIPWLDLQQQGGGDSIVNGIVQAPGGQRALITFKAGARGKHLRLALRRIAQNAAYLDGPTAIDRFYPVLDLSLLHAPWEEVD